MAVPSTTLAFCLKRSAMIFYNEDTAEVEVARGDRGWPAGSPACSVVAAVPNSFFPSRRLEAAELAEANKMVGQRAGPERVQIGTRFAAWLGLTPRQNSSGGKQTLGDITKQGNRYIRKLLVLGATSCSTSWASAKAPCATGSSCFWRRSRREWLLWRSLTSWPGSSGR